MKKANITSGIIDTKKLMWCLLLKRVSFEIIEINHGEWVSVVAKRVINVSFLWKKRAGMKAEKMRI